ncbi:unnamed protein product, partial [Prorocentrum cordatum]
AAKRSLEEFQAQLWEQHQAAVQQAAQAAEAEARAALAEEEPGHAGADLVIDDEQDDQQ